MKYKDPVIDQPGRLMVHVKVFFVAQVGFQDDPLGAVIQLDLNLQRAV